MAVNLSIKNVPDDIARGMRVRADRNHRSLQKELLVIVEQAARAEGRSRSKGCWPERGLGA
jgi:antitoxin FitA